MTEHIVEFKPGIGIVLDGVVDTSQGTGNGPYTWTKPANSRIIDLHSGCAGGGKGGNGGVNGSGASGGGGGGSGAHLINAGIPTLPGTTLTITLGAGGTTGSTAGGNTSTTWSANAPTFLVGGTTLTLVGGTGGSNGSNGTSVAGAAGGGVWSQAYAGSAGASTPTAGGVCLVAPSSTILSISAAFSGLLQFGIGGAGSGGVGSSSASNGGASLYGVGIRGAVSTPILYGIASGTYSGGGAASHMPWGTIGAAGSGNASGSANASAGSGYGCGGSGGGGANSGTATGADGLPGYYRIIYTVDEQDFTSTQKTSITSSVPSVIAIRTEMDSNSTQLAAVKLQTDKIPASPAAVGSAMTLTSAYDAAKSALTSLGTNAPSGWINAAAIAASALNGKGDWSTYAGGDTSGTTTLLSRIIGTLAAGTHNAQTGDSYARLGAPVHASISADIAAIGTGSDSPGVTTLLTRVVGTIAAGTHNPQSGDSYTRLGAPTGVSIAADIHNITVSAGDPWATIVPGTYADGTAGKLFGKLDVGEPSAPVIVIPGSPQDATTARVYGYFKTLENISATAIPVKFTLFPKEAVKATTILVPEIVNASIKNGQLLDDNGNKYVTLILNESITPTGTYYQVDIPKASITKTFYLNSSTITSGLFDLATVITG